MRIALSVPSGAGLGSTHPVTISTTAVGDPGVGAAVTVHVRVTGLPIELLIAAVLIGAASLLVLVAVVRRRRRPRP